MKETERMAVAEKKKVSERPSLSTITSEAVSATSRMDYAVFFNTMQGDSGPLLLIVELSIKLQT